MIELLFNFSMIGPKPTGLGVYSRNCLLALERFFRFRTIASNSFGTESQRYIDAPDSVAIGGGIKSAIKRQLWARSLIIGDEMLVYSPTHHGMMRAKRQIITIHDLICMRYPGQHKPQYFYFKYILPRLLRKCDAVFTVSHTSKTDIAKTYNFPLDKIFVVPNAVEPRTYLKAVPTSNKKPFLLMVGARYPHKNVDEVLEFSEIWRDKYDLVVTSASGKYADHLKRKVILLGLQSHVQFLGYVEQSELDSLYSSAAALIYPSKWEGFGIPPLEALAAGSTVIASDIPVHREVLEDCCQYVTLGDKLSWEIAIGNIDDFGESSKLLGLPKRILDKYSFDNHASSLKAALLSVDPMLKNCLL